MYINVLSFLGDIFQPETLPSTLSIIIQLVDFFFFKFQTNTAMYIEKSLYFLLHLSLGVVNEIMDKNGTETN